MVPRRGASFGRRLRIAAAAFLLGCAGAAWALPGTPARLLAAGAEPSDAVHYRIFLRDGSMLVSYGEFALVADRVVATIPIGGTDADPVLHVLSIPQNEVEWERTNAYAQAARARRYAETRGEADFARLTTEVADALLQVGAVSDPMKRVAIAEASRKRLIEWPQQHYGYRAAELAQMATWLDQVVSELRVAAGQSGFDLALIATPAPTPAPSAQLLPAPTLRERVEFGLIAARRATDAAGRVSLLQAVLEALRPAAGTELTGWAAAVHARAAAELAIELKTDKAYGDVVSKALSRAGRLAARADVRGLESLVRWVLEEDARLERVRPAQVAALLGTLDARIDAARRLRLARDAWVLRGAVLRKYWRDIRSGLDRLLGVREWLTDVRQLAGPAPGSLRRLADHVARAQRDLARVDPPAEVANAHATLAAASTMAARAAAGRFDAVRTGNMDAAWQASSAAAGALLLLDQAVGDLRRITRAPEPAAQPR